MARRVGPAILLPSLWVAFPLSVGAGIAAGCGPQARDSSTDSPDAGAELDSGAERDAGPGGGSRADGGTNDGANDAEADDGEAGPGEDAGPGNGEGGTNDAGTDSGDGATGTDAGDAASPSDAGADAFVAPDGGPVHAVLQISEVAASNGPADGYDFVELFALTGGPTSGLVLRQGTQTVATLGAMRVAAGDRIVVHLTGGSCPAGETCTSEDSVAGAAGTSAKSAARSPGTLASDQAWDVYSPVAGLLAADTVVEVVDGSVVVDAVAVSDRSGAATAASTADFASAASAGAWVFSASPAVGGDACATQKDAVSIRASASPSPCARGAAVGPRVSLQRAGTSDTNSKRDFYASAQTPGLPNGPNAPPVVLAVDVIDRTTLDVRFDQEVDPTTLTAAGFRIAGLVVTSASALDVDAAELKTSAQTAGAPYDVVALPSVTDLQGVRMGSPDRARVCGYAPLGPSVLVNELEFVSNGVDAKGTTIRTDRVELRVVQGGNLGGVDLRLDLGSAADTRLATLPPICGVAGDLVVVHLNPAKASGTAPTSETLAKNELPAAKYAGNYDTAYDVLGLTPSIATTHSTLTVLSAAKAYLDGVAFSNQSATTSASYVTSLGTLQRGRAWLPADCSGAPCSDTSSPTASSIGASVQGMKPGSGTSAARDALGTDTNSARDFSIGPSTMGSPNR